METKSSKLQITLKKIFVLFYLTLEGMLLAYFIEYKMAIDLRWLQISITLKKYPCNSGFQEVFTKNAY